jgi:muramoyltetrapeptide carboxypeptidase
MTQPAKGLTIGILAPSGSVDPDLLARGVYALEQRGARVLVHEQTLQTWRYFAGSDAARVDAIHDFALDPQIDVVMAARGGYGLSRIVDQIDFDAVAKSRKVWCGFSDFTAFNMGALSQSSFLTLHGPMLTGDFGGTPNAFMESTLWPLLAGKRVQVEVEDAHATLTQPVAGRVWGGNLSVLSRLLATPYAHVVEGGILFLEDINEEPYAIERMFLQLKQMGVLAAQRAVVLGQFTACEARNPQRYAYTLAEALETLYEISPVPVLANFPFGHVARKATLPIGGVAEIEQAVGGYSVGLKLG